MLSILYKTILITLMTTFLPSFVFACSCGRATPEQELKDATAVFSGSVGAPETSTINDFVRRVFPFIERIRPRPYLEIIPTTFDVKKVWKGQRLNQITVFHGTNGTSCGVKFKPRVEYLVYTYEWKGKLTTGLCTRTTELSAATEDLIVLGEGIVPPSRGLNSRNAILWASGILFLLTLIVWGIIQIRNAGVFNQAKSE